MKKLLTNLSFVLMVCLIFASCKDDKSPYPSSIDGLWAGGNASTGYVFNVVFATNASSGRTSSISIVSPGKKDASYSKGRFTYDQNSGVAEFQPEVDGAPVATFQVDENGTVLSASIKIDAANYENYTLNKVKLPTTIAGAWSGTGKLGDASLNVSARFEAFAVNGGIPVVVSVEGFPTTFKGTYTYKADTGVAEVKIESFDPSTLTYNVTNNTLEGKVAGADVSVERIAGCPKCQ